ncbi:MAG: Stk1 family PASTA domain-containing Ser/Thr kinase [Ornithinimicrobium sp.]
MSDDQPETSPGARSHGEDDDQTAADSGSQDTPAAAQVAPSEGEKAPAKDFVAPRVLGGRYEVGELIGRGGMAEVHLGHDLRLGRPVAIKILRNELARDTSFLARFRREAQAAAGLNHPAIVAVYDSGEQEVTESGGAPLQVPYIVMERVEGRTLRDVLNDEQVLDPDEAARVTASVLSGMAYAHDKGIVHRDIKPANVMISRAGAVKVMDFGIARALADTAATMTQTQAVLGTARYLSPEQAQGNPVDARSDLYSAGCLLYELLAGRTPFQGDPVALVYQHLGEKPQPPSTYQSDIPPAFDAIALHALAKTPQTRYQSADEFRADLMAARSGEPISAPAATTGAQATGASSPSAGRMAAGGLAGGAAGAVAGRVSRPGAATEAIPTSSGPRTAARSGGGAGADGASPRGDDFERTDEMPGREERHPGGYWVLGALALLALAAIAFVVFQVFGPADDDAAQVQVPFLVNMDVADARDALSEANLEAEVEREVSSEPVDEVIDQDPSANTSVEEGSSVTLTVSSGPDAIEIPDVVGFTEEAARSRLEGEGLSVASDSDEANDVDFAAGEVVSTAPQAGQSVSPDDEVTLTLASGLVSVPDVVGQDSGDAFATLRDLRLSPATTFQESNESPGTVLEQSVDEGEDVEYGTRVTLTVAQSPVPTVTQTQTQTQTITAPQPEPSTTEPTTDQPSPTTEDPTPTTDPAQPTTDPAQPTTQPTGSTSP